MTGLTGRATAATGATADSGRRDMVRVRRDPLGSVLEARSGGGCVGCLGIAFALWACLIGSIFVGGWHAGDFSGDDDLVLVVAPFFLGLFFLCGMGVGTYRCRYRFDATRRTVKQTVQIFFLPYRRRQWSIDDFSAVELWLYRRRQDNVTTRIHVIRLLPSESAGAPAEPRELGSGGAGAEMRAAAREIAEFSGLPLREPPAGIQ